MRNSTHIARLLKACKITTGQLLSFVRQSKHLTVRQRAYLLSMRNSLYSEIARSAALHEKCGSLDQAAKLWRQANQLAVLKDNIDWTAHRAHVCEARLRLAAKAARVRNGGGSIPHANPQP